MAAWWGGGGGRARGGGPLPGVLEVARRRPLLRRLGVDREMDCDSGPLYCKLPDFAYSTPARFIRVVVGTNHLTTGGQQYDVERAIVHEQYDSARIRNDICLLYLNEDMTFNELVRPVALPRSDTEPGADLMLTGWGRLSYGLSAKKDRRNRYHWCDDDVHDQWLNLLSKSYSMWFIRLWSGLNVVPSGSRATLIITESPSRTESILHHG
ncbi:Chymotrypsin-1 [Eumeta japonica]|uniref:Chymotrypsin-1 n=1 Tax=Eumeta variegata TaxID=151549 RepID=A0A4C1YSS6_EUMVA|nr:Chymotrypsin-1 [Eumeta japonica]